MRDNPEHLAHPGAVAAVVPAGGAVRRRRRARRELVRGLAPDGDLRMSASPHANGGLLTRDLDLPDFRDYAVDVPRPARAARGVDPQARRAAARHLHAATRTGSGCSARTRPTATGSARSSRSPTAAFMERVTADDVAISRDGRVMEVLSEHNCHGWLEGYTLTGRHGMFATYEAFAMVSASQTVQHGKWLQEAKHLPWRAKVPSLNVLLTSTAWRNDHNGFSPPGPRPDPGGAHPARRRRPGLPAAGRQLPAVGRRPLPAVAVVHQPDRHRQAAAAAVADHGRGGRALRARRRHLGLGRHRRRHAATRTSCWPAPATS